MSIHKCSSPKLSNTILHGSPSLLWMAANRGDEEEFKLLLRHLTTDEQPSSSQGGTTIQQTALLQNHSGILQCLMDNPKLFPRFDFKVLSLYCFLISSGPYIQKRRYLLYIFWGVLQSLDTAGRGNPPAHRSSTTFTKPRPFVHNAGSLRIP